MIRQIESLVANSDFEIQPAVAFASFCISLFLLCSSVHIFETICLFMMGV